MSYPAKTLFAFGCYLTTLGALLLLVPNMLLGVFRFAPTSEVWIHVVGMLVIFLGIYYFTAARSGLRPFMVWSVPVRASVVLFFGAFVVAGLAPPILLLFGAVDLSGALWTWSALREEAAGHRSHAA